DRIIIRRALDPAPLATLAPLDFGATSSEAVTATPGVLTVLGRGTSSGLVGVEFITANGTDAGIFFAPLTSSTRSYGSVPAALLTPTDLHGFLALATDSLGTRVTEIFAISGGDRTIQLGPALIKPTITFASTTPYLRPNMQ